ncbi:hypothetical protein HRbin23_00730 [bacterium HR23]|nr:hypothetical protein HRbin23_00730 [bacterium HR23]
MFKRLENLSYRALWRAETLKRTLPFWVLVLLVLALEACRKKK